MSGFVKIFFRAAQGQFPRKFATKNNGNIFRKHRQLIALAVKEDVGKGDVTTLACVDAVHKGTGSFIANAPGILCGMEIAMRVFQLMNEHVRFTKKKRDGAAVRQGDVIAEVNGNLHSLLGAERVALNFIQRMSGIATLTHEYVARVDTTNATILDTRKTAPLLRELDKYAVRTGGGSNHRMGLDDMILIKNNHIAAAGGVAHAIARCAEFRKLNTSKKLPIEIETGSLPQVKEVLAIGGVQRIMLDNFALPEIRAAVKIVAHHIPLEVSGGVSLQTCGRSRRRA